MEALHYPRSDTVMMVEEAIKKAKIYPTKAELVKRLPKKAMYQKLPLILDYLERSDKIHIDRKDGRIVWIWNPKGVSDVIDKRLVIR